MRRRVLRRLIWVYTVCSGLSVRIYMVNTVPRWTSVDSPLNCKMHWEHAKALWHRTDAHLNRHERFAYAQRYRLIWRSPCYKVMFWVALRWISTYTGGGNFVRVIIASLLWRNLLEEKERICFRWEQVLSFESRPFSERAWCIWMQIGSPTFVKA